MKHLILGNGPTGVVAAETLRRNDPSCEIVLAGAEEVPPYSRMAIPYLLEGNIDESGTYLRKASGHFASHGIRLLQGRAVSLDTRARKVQFADGHSETYDRLLIATGSVPSREKIEGMDLPGVHTCWTLADARAIMAAVRPGTRIVQMGAGFVGCIIIQGLISRGAQLTILVRSGRMVSRMMPPKASDMIGRWCEAQGVRIMGKTQAARVERDGSALKVTLTTGETLPADIYLSVVGVKPSIDFLAGSGIAIQNGIVVDECMRTNVPGIYAAGDVAESRDCLYGNLQVNAIQPNAVEQARIAAISMAGGDARFVGSLAINVLNTLGLVSSSFGQWQGEEGGSGVEHVDADAWRYLSLEFKDDVMIGATAIGLTEHIGVLRGLIQNRLPLGHWKDALLENPTRFVEAYVANSQPASLGHALH